MFDIVWPYFTLQQPPLPLWRLWAHQGKFHFPKDGQMIYWGRALSIRFVSYVDIHGSIHKPILSNFGIGKANKETRRSQDD